MNLQAREEKKHLHYERITKKIVTQNEGIWSKTCSDTMLNLIIYYESNNHESTVMKIVNLMMENQREKGKEISVSLTSKKVN